jgi:hypothetical protein
MSSRVFTHLFRVYLASGTFYSSQRLHMEVNTSRNYHNINNFTQKFWCLSCDMIVVIFFIVPQFISGVRF